MVLPRIGISLALVCCSVACGDRPDLPGPATPNGTTRDNARTGGASQEVEAPPPAAAAPREVEADVEPLDVASVDGASVDAGSRADVPVESGGVVQPASSEASEPEGPAVAACTRTRLGCVTLYISKADAAAKSCLQLTLDDCGDTTRPGLDVSLPISWRLGSGFVGTLGDACVPGTPFEVNNLTIGSGSGSIRWNQQTRQPSEIVIDVTLQPLGTGDLSGPISFSSGDLVDPLLECAD